MTWLDLITGATTTQFNSIAMIIRINYEIEWIGEKASKFLILSTLHVSLESTWLLLINMKSLFNLCLFLCLTSFWRFFKEDDKGRQFWQDQCSTYTKGLDEVQYKCFVNGNGGKQIYYTLVYVHDEFENHLICHCEFENLKFERKPFRPRN